LTALFAPPDRREALLALYAFNAEVARIRETVTEPVLGQMRIQWWRDTLSGFASAEAAPSAHPTAQALGEVIARYDLP
jgi:phytoene synthase